MLSYMLELNNWPFYLLFRLPVRPHVRINPFHLHNHNVS